MSLLRSHYLPHALFGAYLLLCGVLAISPYDRMTWFVENLTMWVIVGALVFWYARGIRFSLTAYICMSVLVFLHTIGGHYTFERVPFDIVTDFFGFERNHYDRIAHFSVGLYAYAIAEWLVVSRGLTDKLILLTYPVLAIATVAMSYELIEWVYAAQVSPEAGAAYLGSQGDIWDAQKDMLADTLGALCAVLLYWFHRRSSFHSS
jgi:putative membrane protein